jgi:hypothetical protein
MIVSQNQPRSDARGAGARAIDRYRKPCRAPERDEAGRMPAPDLFLDGLPPPLVLDEIQAISFS